MLCNSNPDVATSLNLIRIVAKISITVVVVTVHNGDSFVGNDGLLCARKVALGCRLLNNCLVVCGDYLLLRLLVVPVGNLSTDIVDLVLFRHGHLFVNNQTIGPWLHHQLLYVVFRLQVLYSGLAIIWLRSFMIIIIRAGRSIILIGFFLDHFIFLLDRFDLLYNLWLRCDDWLL